MKIVNEWLIFDTSAYDNFARIKIDKVDGYVYYMGDKSYDNGDLQPRQNYIRFYAGSFSVDVYYKNEADIRKNIIILDKIMWDYENNCLVLE